MARTLNPKNAAWVRILLALTLVGVVLVAYVLATATIYPVAAKVASTFEPGAAPDTLDVVALEPGSAEQKAGLRVGDTLELRNTGWVARSWLLRPYADATMTLAIERKGRLRTAHVRLPAAPLLTPRWGAAATPDLQTIAIILGDFWMLAFAYVVGRKHPDDPEVRSICYILLTYAIGSGFLNSWWLLPALSDVSLLLAEPMIVLSTTLFSLFALSFVPRSPAKAILQRVAWAFLGIAILLSLGTVIRAVTGFDFFHLAAAAAWTGIFNNGFHYVMPRSLALLCGLWAIATSRGVARQRIAWATISVAFLYGTTLISQPLVMLGLVPPSFGDTAVAIGVFLVPMGLTYAVLSRRLLDIGFVFNRAAVFSAVSIVLVGAFVLVEWPLTDWLRNASHTANILVSAGIALALGLSTRYVHARADHVVDNIFFRKRHEGELAIRQFAQEAPYITDKEILLERAITLLERHADATFAHIAADDGRGRYGQVSENDPAIVRLRATHQTLDLHTVDSHISGEFAYPMVARGRLVGVLAIGPRRSGETYAPDESAAIARLAHSVGAALDVLSARADDSSDIRQSLDLLQETVVSLRDAIVGEHPTGNVG